MELYEHQKKFLAENPDRCALVWSCGTGKTRAALEWVKLEPNRALVICPKALKANWIREADKWGAKVDVATKEEFKKLAMAGKMPKYWCVIVDECHNGFLTPHFKSQMSKALKQYLFRNEVERILMLSATIYTSSPWNVFTLAHLLGHKWNWLEFNYTFFNQIRMGGRLVPVVKKGIEKRLADAVKKIASVVDISECMDIPLQQHLEPEYFELTDEQKDGIEDAYDPVHIVRYTRQHEIENGVLIGDSNGLVPSRTFESDKMQRVIDLIAENKKCAVVCRYNMQIDSLHRMIQHQLKEKMVYIIRGDVKDRDRITREAEDSEDCVVLIQADCAEGYQLPSFPVCVFASMSYSYAKYEQVCGRFLRMDKPSRTTFFYLLTEGKSVDQAVYDAIMRKEDFQIKLYGKN